MKESAPDSTPLPEDPWAVPEYKMGKDGYPVFPHGQGGLAGEMATIDGRGRTFQQEIAKTLSYHLGRPVVDGTGLKGKYDIDMTWTIDLAWIMESAGLRDQIPEGADDGPRGPTLIHAVRDRRKVKATLWSSITW